MRRSRGAGQAGAPRTGAWWGFPTRTNDGSSPDGGIQPPSRVRIIGALHPLVQVVTVWVWRWVTVPAVTLRRRVDAPGERPRSYPFGVTIVICP
jgi:hypothetical protein